MYGEVYYMYLIILINVNLCYNSIKRENCKCLIQLAVKYLTVIYCYLIHTKICESNLRCET